MAITINGTGSITGLTAGGLPDASITSDDIAAGAVTAAKIGYAGAILQVVSANKSDTFSTSVGTTYTDITGLSVSITPTSASSKILVFFNVVGTSPDRAYVKLLRGSTDVAVGDAAGSRVQCTFNDFYDGGDTQKVHNASAFYLDSPATTASTTYKLQARCASGGSIFYVNRSANDPDNAGSGRGHSNITVMEVTA